MDILLKEKPLSLRTLCCISFVVNKRENENIPKEILETVKTLRKPAYIPLLAYIDCKKTLSPRVFGEFFISLGKIMGPEQANLDWKKVKMLRKEAQLFQRFVTSFVPTQRERKEMGVFRKRYFAELLLSGFDVSTTRKEVSKFILWTGPELPRVFYFA
ncbi:hypothetical protein ISTM_347 [Insectomime virus]|uniref:Uncharacterized protein n=1 Tax=Tunisvirus fontaine2 TaxID=1421067 RepID=V9SEL8_9VIRU|nr:hypothetical protein D1R32_gp453 [Tunisvirus fontaine2]AHA46245.1 hypothetical protein ISTM_347 [Insectomime virus]AHC55170.1 hypothetical protein TNS_ORF452 [Tunisvirus fontaine2]